MKKLGLIVLLLFTNAFVFAQNEASVWYFGQNAGLQFNAANNTVTALADGQINTLEGCTSISDADGNLLFYSDGQTVWSNNHQVMPNGNYSAGTGLLGDPSSTSSGLIVPRPNHPNEYYLFTVDEPHHSNASTYPNQFSGTYDGGGTVPSQDDGFNNGFNYSLIDMSLNGGLGDVDPIVKNVHLVTYNSDDPEEIKYKCSEKITAVKSGDCESFWVITHFVDSFYAFKVTENGVLINESGEEILPEISQIGPEVSILGYRKNALGYIKASPDGTKLVVAHNGFEDEIAGSDAPGGVYLFDFNNESGEVSNSVELYSPAEGNSPYGVEFSADNKKVYATIGMGNVGIGGSQIRQWDLEATDIPGSNSLIHESSTISAGALQLGINGRIYRAQLEFQTNTGARQFLGIINNPEANAEDVTYNQSGINLGSGESRVGLPPFIQSLFNSEIDIIQNGISTTDLKLCTGDSYTLQAIDIVGADYVWSFDGNPIAETSPQLFVDSPGFYEVYIEPNNGDCPIEGNAVVGVFEYPVANLPENIYVCDDISNDGIESFDFTDKNAEALLAQDPLLYAVSYFVTETDANSGENKITFPFSNTINPQPIFVRVENAENSNCFDTTEFQLTVFSKPQIAEDINTIEICDNLNDEMDGIATINLEDLIPTIRGNQEETETEITFHGSEADANDNANAFTLNYINATAFEELIYYRIENSSNPDAFSTDCYSIGSFNFIVNPSPVANDLSILQCDEDGIPEGFTTFNINNHLDDITDNATNNSIEFYLSLADADIQENAINGESFDNFLNPQIIYARVSNTETDCINFSEISLSVSTTSSNNTSIELCDSDGTEDGFIAFNLSEANDNVLSGAPAGLDLVYYETYEDALLETNSIGTTFTNTIPYNQTIYARVENANDCYGISEIELKVFELPNIETEFETLYCLNFFPETITLNGGVLADSPSNYYYEWLSTSENTSEIEINAIGTYTVRVTNTNGCYKDRTITVLPSNSATILNIEVIDASQNNTISVILSNDSVGDYEYALDNSNGPYQDSNTFYNVQHGLHTVYVRDKNECGIVDDLVSVIGFPKYFTPNNDNAHDYWQVQGITEQFQAKSTIFIFDRYGKLLKELNPLSVGWDGIYNGEHMPTSDYWFKVTLEDGRTFTSHFTLKR